MPHVGGKAVTSCYAKTTRCVYVYKFRRSFVLGISVAFQTSFRNTSDLLYFNYLNLVMYVPKLYVKSAPTRMTVCTYVARIKRPLIRTFLIVSDTNSEW